MGLLNGLMKSGLAAKAVQEARKPQNQARLRAAAQKVMASRRGGGNGTGGTGSTAR